MTCLIHVRLPFISKRASNIPAAPAPTTSTLFFPSLLLPPAMFVVGRIGSVSCECSIGTQHLCDLLQSFPRQGICCSCHNMNVEQMRHEDPKWFGRIWTPRSIDRSYVANRSLNFNTTLSDDVMNLFTAIMTAR
jgi:hypothetical protein